ncbi:hypothetical protein [Dickeya fangzhongdai]|uniref:hypothetical protein n=1 Tax=Dickeya fangzhongdai TaxID=1778540 RepID=UPI0026E0D8CF|nr:hypothetical protein [Dickeya fangzhongdai]WKV51547.1 hypothetical protein PL145_04655 [Dickeya fangzhongdai]
MRIMIPTGVVRWGLGVLAVGLITSAQAGESFCLAVKAPSKSALLSTASRPPSPQPQAIPVMHTEGTLPHQGIYDMSNAARRDFGYMRDLALAWRMAGDAASRVTAGGLSGRLDQDLPPELQSY